MITVHGNDSGCVFKDGKCFIKTIKIIEGRIRLVDFIEQEVRQEAIKYNGEYYFSVDWVVRSGDLVSFHKYAIHWMSMEQLKVMIRRQKFRRLVVVLKGIDYPGIRRVYRWVKAFSGW